ncbi:MAG: GspH/FimT family pseudopilin [Caldimonas sp.]
MHARAALPRPTRRCRAAVRGFTMVELLTVMSIVVIILGVMAPSFTEFLAAQQAKGLSYDLTGDLMLARNEALKRNGSVRISRGGADWSQGWSVISVNDGESLSTRNRAGQSVTITGAPATITFDFNGRVSSPTASVRITISSSSSSRCVQLDPSGRARAVHGACA